MCWYLAASRYLGRGTAVGLSQLVHTAEENVIAKTPAIDARSVMTLESDHAERRGDTRDAQLPFADQAGQLADVIRHGLLLCLFEDRVIIYAAAAPGREAGSIGPYSGAAGTTAWQSVGERAASTWRVSLRRERSD